MYFDKECCQLAAGSEGISASIFLTTEDDPVSLGHHLSFPIFPASLVIDICCTLLCEHFDEERFEALGLAVIRTRFKDGIRLGETASFGFATEWNGDKVSRVEVLVKVDDREISTIELGRKNFDAPVRSPEPDPGNLEFQQAIRSLPQRYPLIVIDRTKISEKRVHGIAVKFASCADYYFRDTQKISDSDHRTAFQYRGKQVI